MAQRRRSLLIPYEDHSSAMAFFEVAQETYLNQLDWFWLPQISVTVSIPRLELSQKPRLPDFGTFPNVYSLPKRRCLSSSATNHFKPPPEKSTSLSRVAKSLEIFSMTFCHLVIIEILLHACFECFLDIVVQHILSKKHR